MVHIDMLKVFCFAEQLGPTAAKSRLGTFIHIVHLLLPSTPAEPSSLDSMVAIWC
jgi:hypothetical protein